MIKRQRRSISNSVSVFFDAKEKITDGLRKVMRFKPPTISPQSLIGIQSKSLGHVCLPVRWTRRTELSGTSFSVCRWQESSLILQFPSPFRHTAPRKWSVSKLLYSSTRYKHRYEKLGTSDPQSLLGKQTRKLKRLRSFVFAETIRKRCRFQQPSIALLERTFVCLS